MADKSIGDLNVAPGSVDDSNTLFVCQQAGAAYKLDGHALVLALTTILDGHGGISNISYTAPSSGSLNGTMTITLADQSVETFTIRNGKDISSITQYFAVNNNPGSVPSSWSTTRQTMTASNRYLWSYFHFAFNDGTSSDTPKTVIGVQGETGDAWYVWIRYAGSCSGTPPMPASDSDIGTTPDNWIGVYSGLSSTAPTTRSSYSWFEMKGEKGDTGDASSISSQSVAYAASLSGTTVPSSGWSDVVPQVAPGSFLWTRTELNFNDGTTVDAYSVSRFGIDGAGSVASVNSISPDAFGDVVLTATNIQASDSSSVQTHISNIETALDGIAAANVAPVKDGDSAVIGTSTRYARQDHVHPLNVPISGTPSADGIASSGSAVTYARSDHVHPLNVPSSGTPAMDGTASRGSAVTYARSDHVHPTDTSRASAYTVSTLSTTVTNLSNSFKAWSYNLSQSSWVNNTQVVYDNNFLANGYAYIVSPSPSNFKEYVECMVYADNVIVDGQMTFHCDTTPTVNVSANIVRVVSS